MPPAKIKRLTSRVYSVSSHFVQVCKKCCMRSCPSHSKLFTKSLIGWYWFFANTIRKASSHFWAEWKPYSFSMYRLVSASSLSSHRSILPFRICSGEYVKRLKRIPSNFGSFSNTCRKLLILANGLPLPSKSRSILARFFALARFHSFASSSSA